MHTQLARPEITLSLALAADLGAIDTDPGKLQHILRHLLDAVDWSIGHQVHDARWMRGEWGHYRRPSYARGRSCT